MFGGALKVIICTKIDIDYFTAKYSCSFSTMLAWFPFVEKLIMPPFSFLLVTSTTWYEAIIPWFQNFISWDYQRSQNCNPSYMSCSSPSTWSLCWETCSLSWPSAQSPTSTHPCTNSSLTCPWLTSASPPPLSQRCCWTSRHRAKPSPIQAASLRCIFSYSLQGWMTFSWLWWPMTDMWPSVTLCTTQSSWTPDSVDCWF